MPKPYKYTGILAKPAPLDLRGLDTQSAAAEFREWWGVRIAALFADCGVDGSDPNVWAGVALQLMLRHVPGFSGERGKRLGPPRKTTFDDDISLFMEMNKRIMGGTSVRNAAAIVSRQRRKGEKPGAIDIRYRRILKKIGVSISLLERDER